MGMLTAARSQTAATLRPRIEARQMLVAGSPLSAGPRALYPVWVGLALWEGLGRPCPPLLGPKSCQPSPFSGPDQLSAKQAEQGS